VVYFILQDTTYCNLEQNSGIYTTILDTCKTFDTAFHTRVYYLKLKKPNKPFLDLHQT